MTCPKCGCGLDIRTLGNSRQHTAAYKNVYSCRNCVQEYTNSPLEDIGERILHEIRVGGGGVYDSSATAERISDAFGDGAALSEYIAGEGRHFRLKAGGEYEEVFPTKCSFVGKTGKGCEKTAVVTAPTVAALCDFHSRRKI